MIIVVGFGNRLRGEDAFGVDVILKLKNLNLPKLRLISTFQLTPELTLELQEAKKIIFIDAAYSNLDCYALACLIKESNQNLLSHHISIKTLIAMLDKLYNKKPEFEIFSMLTDSFDEIRCQKRYDNSLKSVANFIAETVKQA